MPPLSERKLKKIRSKFGIILMAAIIFGGVFCYLGDIKQASAAGSAANYQKTASGTLTSTEWNDLFSDFVNTFTQSSMVGPLGIGRTPGVLLDVNGYFRATGATISSIGSGIIMADSSGNLYSTSSVIATGIPSPSGLSGYTLRSDGASWLTSALLFNDGTNIGIGKTNPTVDLDVHGSISADGNVSGTGICIGSDCKVSWPAIIAAGGGNLWSGTTTGAIYNANGVYNVGIGMTNPNAKLDVADTFSVSGASPIFYFGQFRALERTASDLIFGGTSAAAGFSNLRFTTYNGNSIERMRIDNNGNVGIGTTNPGSVLDVAGAAAFNPLTTTAKGTVTIGTPGATGASLFVNTPGLDATYNAGFAVYGSLSYAGGVNPITSTINLAALGARTGTPAGYSNMAFFVSTPGAVSEAMRITSSGNIGIGTTVPGTKLDVNGYFRATAATISAIGSGIIMADSSGNLYSTSTTVATGIPSPSGISGQTLRSDGTNWLANSFLFNTGTNIGIGLTLPAQKLDISGALKLANATVTATDTTIGNRYLCDATTTGTFRYDATSGQSYLCDGTRWLNQKNCGVMTDDEGHTYGTVQIGGQCFMAENINIGTMLGAGTTEPTTTDNIIQKWCYNNLESNCVLYGGLYNWNEAMRGASFSGARGICPAGWHIPTDAEYNTLEKTVLGIINSPNAQYVCDFNTVNTNWYWRRCADNNGADSGGTYGAGKSLKGVGIGSGNGLGNDLVGFNGKLTGYRDTDGTYSSLGTYLDLWSSTPSGASNAWRRALLTSYSTVARLANARAYGFSVRCLRD